MSDLSSMDDEKEAPGVTQLGRYLDDNDIAYDRPAPTLFSFSLPGEKKQQTPVRLDVGTHALGVHAFVCR